MKTVRCTNCKSEIPVVPGRRLICLKCNTDQPPIYQCGSEFCPRCGWPLDAASDPGRLCETCGWFGDWKETLPVPPPTEDFNALLAVLQGLELFRDVCRKEQLVEAHYDMGHLTDHDMRKVRERAQEARQALVTLFTALRENQ